MNVGELQSVLRAAGWPEGKIVLVAAIGMAESSGNPRAVNPRGEHSVGLWQINMRAHGTRYGTESQLYDPLTNARAALDIYRRQGLRAWGAYTDGRYREHMAASEAAYRGGPAAADLAPQGLVGVFLLGLGLLILIRR